MHHLLMINLTDDRTIMMKDVGYDMIGCIRASIFSKLYSKGHLARNNQNQNSRRSSLRHGIPRGIVYLYIVYFQCNPGWLEK
jgi:hypothetical protein